MSLDEEVRALIRSELPAALRELLQGDRREAPRLPEKAPRKAPKRPRKLCPAKGCKNTFAPRYGGYCEDHRTTAGYKAWEKAR